MIGLKSLAVACIAFAITKEGQATPPEIEKMELSAISYRSGNVRRGFVRLHVVNDIHPVQQAEFVYEITFDNDSFKQVRRGRLIGKENWGKATTYVLTGNKLIDDETPEVPVNIVSTKQYANLRERYNILDPRLLGMNLDGIDSLHSGHFESLLNRADRQNIKSKRESIGGLDVIALEYSLEKGQVRVWLAPNQEYSIVKGEFHMLREGKTYTRTLEAKHKQFPNGDIWFPYWLSRTDREDGKVMNHQLVKVEEASFGQPIETSAFQLTGLDIRPGRSVVDASSGVPLGGTWDGSKVWPTAKVVLHATSGKHR